MDDLGEGVVVRDNNPFIFAAPVISRRQFWNNSQMKSRAPKVKKGRIPQISVRESENMRKSKQTPER